MLHQGHPCAAKMDQSAEAFWSPGMYRETRKTTENWCRASGKNLKTQLRQRLEKTRINI